MKNLMLLLAVDLLGFVLATPASAQFYPGAGGYSPQPSPGYGGPGFNPGYGGGYNPSYGGYNPSLNRGHIDYVPGGFTQHRGHLDYVRPHTDYHLGGQRYQVQPGPFGPSVSPFPHHR